MKNKRTAVMISCSGRWYHPKTEWRSRTDIIQGLISGPKSNQQWNVVLNHRLPTYYSNETNYTHASKLRSLSNVFWPIRQSVSQSCFFTRATRFGISWNFVDILYTVFRYAHYQKILILIFFWEFRPFWTYYFGLTLNIVITVCKGNYSLTDATRNFIKHWIY